MIKIKGIWCRQLGEFDLLVKGDFYRKKGTNYFCVIHEDNAGYSSEKFNHKFDLFTPINTFADLPSDLKKIASYTNEWMLRKYSLVRWCEVRKDIYTQPEYKIVGETYYIREQYDYARELYLASVSKTETDEVSGVFVDPYKEKPEEWDGEGLPPVGANILWLSDKYENWTFTNVIAYNDDKSSVWLEGEAIVSTDNQYRFKPTKSPEQEKAETELKQLKIDVSDYLSSVAFSDTELCGMIPDDWVNLAIDWLKEQDKLK